MLTFGTLFSGVGGGDLGFENAGMTCKFQVEWDSHCIQVLEHHWPHIPRWEDIEDVNGADLPPVDVVFFGSPCQDLSVAGKQAGLDGDRSRLFFEAVRVIKEMQDATDGEFPKWLVWENVAGALSSNKGEDFSAVIDNVAELGAVEIEWAVLDAQFFGVPQRRRRIFLVACFDSSTPDRGGLPLLPVTESSQRNSSSSNEAEQDDATTAGSSPAGDDSPPAVMTFVKSRRARSTTDNETWIESDVNPTLNEFDSSAPRTTTAVVHDQFAIPIQDGRGLEKHQNGFGVGAEGDPSYTIDQTGAQSVAQPVDGDRYIVRRLTPIECERLMGWPDDHTLHRADGKETSMTQRYKQIGNGIAAPVAEWVARQIIKGSET